MTNDLVKRLRIQTEHAKRFIRLPDGHLYATYENAADRIEELEKALRVWACDCAEPCTKGRCEAYQAKMALERGSK